MPQAVAQDGVEQHAGQVGIVRGSHGPKARQFLPLAGKGLRPGLTGEQRMRQNLAKVPGGVGGSGRQGLSLPGRGSHVPGDLPGGSQHEIKLFVEHICQKCNSRA
jgi:hypothetical protein